MKSSLAAMLELQTATNRRLLNKAFKVYYDAPKFSFGSLNFNFIYRKEAPPYSLLTSDCFLSQTCRSRSRFMLGTFICVCVCVHMLCVSYRKMVKTHIRESPKAQRRTRREKPKSRLKRSGGGSSYSIVKSSLRG